MNMSEINLGLIANPSPERTSRLQRLSTSGLPSFDGLVFEGQKRLSTSGMPAFDGIIFPNK